MSVLLVLLRHAKSDWSTDAADIDRPLAPRGRRQAPEAGAWLAGSGIALDLAVVSPARRARETWDLAGPGTVPVRVEEAAYTFDADDLLGVVRNLTADRVALVGHNPALEDLVEALTGESVRMPTSSLAVIELPDWGSAGRGWGGGGGLLRAHGRPPAEGPAELH